MNKELTSRKKKNHTEIEKKKLHWKLGYQKRDLVLGLFPFIIFTSAFSTQNEKFQWQYHLLKNIFLSFRSN